jgi:hypothetical protein
MVSRRLDTCACNSVEWQEGGRGKELEGKYSEYQLLGKNSVHPRRRRNNNTNPKAQKIGQ